jgi:hypothetical protein
MNQKLNNDKRRNGHMARILCVGAVLVMGKAMAASGQETNAPSRTNYSFFQIIADRNIFNPDRYSRQSRSRPGRRGAAVDAFALVGTMSYQKGQFAFFDGTSEGYRKVLERNGVIAGYKVAEITPNAVKLEAANKRVELKVGTQMRHEGTNWQLVAQSELPADAEAEASDNPSSSAPSSSTDSGSGGEVNDVLKKLMQRREQELK